MVNIWKKILTDFLGVIAIWGFIALLYLITANLDVLKVFEETVSDFRMTDLYFSKIRDPQSVSQDTNVVIINVGTLPRDGVGYQMQILSEYEPAAIGLAEEFFEASDTQDSMLINDFLKSVSEKVPLIWSSKLRTGGDSAAYFTEDGKKVWREELLPHEKFRPYVRNAFSNLYIEEDDKDSPFETTRFYHPVEYVASDSKGEFTKQHAFPVELARVLNPDAVAEYLEDAEAEEYIYYKGNWNKYTVLDVNDVLQRNFTPETIKGKIILMGYMGDNYRAPTWAGDRFYTPLNPQQVGRTIPDMYEVLVYANIISMILEGTNPEQTPAYLSIVFALIMTYLNVLIFTAVYYSKKLGLWYDVLTKLVQLVEVVVLMYLTVHLFSEYRLILDFTPAILAVVLSGDVLEVFLAFVANLTLNKKRTKFA